MPTHTPPTLTLFLPSSILTHRHNDHVGGLKSVLSLLSALRSESESSSSLPAPRIHKFPDQESDPGLAELLESLPAGSFTAYDAAQSMPLWPLNDGSTVRVSGQGAKSTATLQVVHTPGHTADHICLLLLEEKVLLTGDHVLGQGTTVFEDLSAYLRSLNRCSKVLETVGSPQPHGSENLLYPAHGPVVEQGRKLLKTYLEHRLERERQILQLLRTQPDPSDSTHDTGAADIEGFPWKIRQMVLKLYSNYPENLFPAAARGLFLHLHALATPDAESGRDVRVKCLNQPKYASGSGSGFCPPMPKGEHEWLQVLELDWGLVKGASTRL